MADRPIVLSIITCSDTRSMKEDTAGAALKELIEDEGWTCADHVVIKDDRETIAATIKEMTDRPEIDIVLTCGGSGLSPRDVTPEATQDVCDRNVPGIAEAMRAYSMQHTNRAMLSRALCMQRGTKLVINLPGSEKAARENWAGVKGALAHAVSMMHHEGHQPIRLCDEPQLNILIYVHKKPTYWWVSCCCSPCPRELQRDMEGTMPTSTMIVPYTLFVRIVCFTHYSAVRLFAQSVACLPDSRPKIE